MARKALTRYTHFFIYTKFVTVEMVIFSEKLIKRQVRYLTAGLLLAINYSEPILNWSRNYSIITIF